MPGRQITPGEARAALRTAERERHRVIDQVDLPAWYWWGLAIGWVVLGLITDIGNEWSTSLATLAFGAIHSTVAPRVVHGRHGSNRLSIGRDLVGTRVAGLVLGGLVVLAGVTVAGAFAASADGASHPVTIASLFVAVIIVLGGPRLLAEARRRLAGSAW